MLCFWWGGRPPSLLHIISSRMERVNCGQEDFPAPNPHAMLVLPALAHPGLLSCLFLSPTVL